MSWYKKISQSQEQSSFPIRVWKHHVAVHFQDDPALLSNNGAGKGGTVFTDFEKMRSWLSSHDEREFFVVPINTTTDKLVFEFAEPFMATAKEYLPSQFAFASIDDWAGRL